MSASALLEESQSRYPFIDLLRIFCAFSVVLYHYQIGSKRNDAWQSFTFGEFEPTWTTNTFVSIWTTYGYLGVDIFFFLSGFVILKTIKTRSAGEFLFARFKRLFIPYFIVLIPTSAIYFFYSPKPISLESIALDLTFSSQWRGLTPVIAATWTMVIEITFYLIVSVFIIMISSLRALNLNASMFGMMITWLLLLWITQVNSYPPPFNLLYLNGYAILFLSGAISYYIFVEKVLLDSALRYFILVMLFSSMTIHFYSRMNRNSGTIWYSLIIVLLIFFVTSARGGKWYPRYLSHFTSILGTATYTFYLLHQQIGLFIATWLHSKAGWTLMTSAIFSLTLLLIFSVGIEDLNKKFWKKRKVQT
jgi:peptidoglycan/LPS O-acetylase OafA/YrhL